MLLSVKNITKTYQDGDESTKALKGVSFDVREGEFLCLCGESGCGKTTTLNIIGGMDSADSGSVLFEGNEIVGANTKTLTEYRRKNIGFIFQSYNLMPNLNAKQNIDLIAEIVDNPMNTDEVLELVGLSDKKSKYPSQLSGGQQQRISIARALVKRPKLILADEPTAALDYATSIEVLKTMEKVVSTGTAVLMVTHNLEITKMAKRVIYFKNGEVENVVTNKKPVKASKLEW